MKKIIKKPNLKIPKSLLFFVLVSFLFWMLIKLSKTYESEQKFTLTYINLPSNKLLQNEPLKEMSLELEATGFRLLTSQFSKRNLIVDVKTIRSKAKSKSYILVSKQKNSIEYQLKKGIKITSFYNDTIYFDLGYLASKKLPVVPNYKISYKTGYDLAGKIKFKPDSLVVSGPEKTIDTIKKIKLEFINLKEIDKDINFAVKVKQFKNLKNVRIKDKTVLMKAIVEKFTEDEIEIPFTIINLPTSVQINTFPKTIKVIYRVGLSNFSKVEASSFSIVCDYKYSQENSLSYLIPELKRSSEFASNEKITPTKIDFLIQK